MSGAVRARSRSERLVGAALVAALLAATLPARGADALDRPAQIEPLAATSLLLDVAVLPGGRIVCVGERGHVLVSTDGGQTFMQQPVPTRATLTRVYFQDDRRGWAVGHDEVILRTTDGGSSWTRVHWEPGHRQPLFDVWFGANGTGFAVGAYSTMLRSSDFGATWQPITFEPAAAMAAPKRAAGPADDVDVGVTQPHLYALRPAGDGRLYMAAEAGHVYRSDDAGEHWRELASPYGGTFFGILPLGADAVLAYGLRGHLFRSDDAGATWTAIDTGATDLLAAAGRLPDGGVVIAGLSGVLLVSDDARRFRLHREADRRGYSGVAATGASIVLVGDGGVRLVPVGSLRGTQ